MCLYILPVAQYPEIVPPTIQVTSFYPGASAEVVAATVGQPLEQAINGVEGSIYMSSVSSSDGSYTLTVTFDVGTDLDTSLALVQNLANGAVSQLPGGAQAQGVTVRKVSPNILLVASLYSDDDRFEEIFLSNYALINLQNPLARLPGVGQVRIFGAGPYSMRVWLDPKRLQTFGITTADVLTAIQGQNVQVVAGQLGAPPVPDDQPFQFTINALGRLSDASQFEEIIVKSATGTAPQVVRLRDVARVDLSQQSFSNFSRFSGHKSAQIVMFALPGANAIQVANQVYAAMADMSKQFPEGMKYAIRYDTTLFVREAIRAVYETLFIAGVLVLIVILVFLQNFRAMLVPATTVPVTIIGAFIAMAMLGFTVNLMTLFALILAIGIVVDDAIIIVENSAHYIEHRDVSQGRHDQGHAGADGAGGRDHAGPRRRLSAGRVPAGHHRSDLPPVRARHRRDRRHQRAQRADLEAGPVRDVVEASREQTTQRVLPRIQPGVSEEHRLLRGSRQPDGETARAHVHRVRRHRGRDRLGIRAPAHRLPPDRGPGLRRSS